MNDDMDINDAWRARWQLGRWLPWCLLLVSLLLVTSQVQRPRVLLGVWVPWAEIGCLALVMTPVVLLGGIDLSVGSTVALSGVVLGLLTERLGAPLLLAMPLTLLVGTVAGAANAALVVIGISPLVATLATMAFYRGLAMSLSSAERITLSVADDAPLAGATVGGIPLQYGLLLALFGVLTILVHRTIWGRWIFAIGDNRTAAKFAAVPERTVDCWAYTACGAVAAMVAVLEVLRHNVAMPDAHVGMELQAIACIVVGGTLITGGRGSVPKTLLGLAVVSNLDVALQFLSTRIPFVSSESRMIVTGVLLITVAVWAERTDGGSS